MPKKAGIEAWKSFKRLIEENPVYKDMVLIEIEPCAAETMRVLLSYISSVRQQGILREL